MRPVLRRLKRDVRGASAVEYGFLIALVALAAIGAIKAVASGNTGMWDNVSQQVIANGPKG